MISLNNVTTTNAYSNANTVAQAETARVNLYISNAAIFWRWASRDGTYRPEEFLLPGLYSFDLHDVYAVAVRSGAVGVPAQVTITLKTQHDLGPGIRPHSGA